MPSISPSTAAGGGLALPLAEIALAAGAAILACGDRGVDVAQKADSSPVTEADRAAEEIILAELARRFPDCPAIAEEAAAGGVVPAVEDRFFLVDPLDGTREFVAGRGEFTVNIALITAGRPVAGVVYAPALAVLAVADAEGAWQASLTPDQPVAEADWQRLATRAIPESGPAAVASRSHRDAETDAFLDTHGISEILSAGSSLKFILLARGEADVYPRFGRTMEWDTAAGHAVLSRAGGVVVTTDGAELGYGKRASGYANPAFIAWGQRPESG